MPKLLVIGHNFPEPNSTAAGSRMLQLLQLFYENDYEIFFGSAASRNENSADLKEYEAEMIQLKINDPEVNSVLQKIDPDIVIFDRFMTEEQFGWRVDENCPKALKILDTEDLHFLRNARFQAFKEEKEASDFYNTDLSKREIAAIYRCDLSLIISSAEMAILERHFNIPEKILLYLPFLIDEISKEHSGYKKRKDFMSIGNFLHKPNRDAVIYLKKMIWPKIRKRLPEADLYLYGAYPDDVMMKFHDPKNGFIIKGHIQDTEQIFEQHRVLLAPLRFGAGLKGKFFDSMKYGMPSVTFPVGAEGISEKSFWNGAVASSEEDFVDQSVAIHVNEEKWKKSVQNGYEILNNNFRKEKFSEEFMSRIQNTKINLNEHRSQNFIGEMMKYHLSRSTRFLSKYIEIKNKFQQ